MSIINDVLVNKLFKDPPKRTKEIPLLSEKTASGDGMVVINDAYSDFPITNLTLRGKSEQVTTTGKNLFDYKDFVDINTYIDNIGSYRRKYLQLKPNTAYRVTIFKNRMTPAGDTTVMFIGDKETYDNTSANGIIAFFTSNEKKSATITTKESGQIVFKLNANSTPELQEEYLSQADIIFSEGTTEIPYEPYTGGKPSPSPEYPQEIKSVGKWNEKKQKYEVDVVVSGKNLFDKESAKIKENWIRRYPNNVNNLMFKVYIGDAKQVTASIKTKLVNGLGFNVGIVIDENPGTYWIYSGTNELATTYKQVVKTEKKYVYVLVNTIAGIDEFLQKVNDFQIEIGVNETDFEPYREPQTVKLSLDQPLRGIGKYKDEVTKDGIIRRIKQIVLNGSEEWILHNNTSKEKTQAFGIEVDTMCEGVNIGGICNRFLPKYTVWIWDNEGFDIYAKHTLYINIEKTKASSVVEFKKWLSENQVTVEVILAEPIIEPLPEDFKQAIESLKTYYPTTVVTADGGELPVGIEVTYMHPEYIPTKQSALRMWFKENPII